MQRECDCSAYEFVEGVPSELNRKIQKGTIDVSPSSSIEYLRHPERYDLLENHSVSCRGPVRSIFLFSKRPLDELAGAAILTSSQSETSVALLSIILQKFLGIECLLTSSSEPLDKGLSHAEAYMLIGDDALAEALKWRGPHRYDLGEIWFRHTGLPFTFALWISAKGCCSGKEGLLKQFRDDLDKAKSYALKNLEEIAGASPLKVLLSEEDLIQYWRGISYDFGPDHRKGLDLFKKFAAELKLL